MSRLLFAFCALLLASCKVPSFLKFPPKSPLQQTKKYNWLKKPSQQPSASEQVAPKIDEDDVYWVSEDVKDPIDAALLKKWQSNNLEQFAFKGNYHVLRKARGEKKQILLWYSHPSSLPDNKLRKTFLTDAKILPWIKQNFIILIVSTDPKLYHQKSSFAIGNHVEKMCQRYQLRTTPTLVVLSASGAEIMRHRGYSENQHYFLQKKLQQALVTAKKSSQQWYAKLRKKKYRFWYFPEEKLHVFAKKIKFQPAMDIDQERVTIITPSGKKIARYVRNLSKSDQQWLRDNLL